MCKNLKAIICVAIIMTTIVTSTGCSLVKEPKAKMKPELLKAEEKKFQTYVVKKGSMRYEDKGVGNATSQKIVNINSALVNGVVEDVCVKPWGNVKKGDIIVRCFTKDIENKIEIQEIAVEEYESELNTIKKDNVSQDKIEKADLALKREKAVLRQLNEEKDAHIFKSPIDGVVGSIISAERGKIIGMNEPIATVMDANSLSVVAIPEEKELKKYYVGMKAELVCNNKVYNAEVKEIGLIGNESSKNKRGVIFQFKDQIPDGLKIGDTVTYKVFGEDKGDVTVIPETFLKVDESKKAYVYIFKDEIREKRFVEIGISNGELIEIKSGLEVDETIILK